MAPDPQLRQPPKSESTDDLPLEGAPLEALVTRPEEEVGVEDARGRRPPAHDERQRQGHGRREHEWQRKAQPLHAQLAGQAARVVAHARADDLCHKQLWHLEQVKA